MAGFGSKPGWKGSPDSNAGEAVGGGLKKAADWFTSPVRPFVDGQGNAIPGTGPNAANPPAPVDPNTGVPDFAPWRSKEDKAEFYNPDAVDRKQWADMQEAQRWAGASESEPLTPGISLEEYQGEARVRRPVPLPEAPTRSGGGGAYGAYSSRSRNPSYAKWLDTYTVEAALNARDRDELELINQGQQAQAHARADWNQERAFEKREAMDLANQELGMMRSELGNASRMYREQLASTGSVYNPGSLQSALLGIGNAVFGGGVERGAEILNNLAQKDLDHQKLLLQNSARIEDSLLGRFQQITGEKDKAEQLYLAFTKDQQAEQARVLALKVTNVEVRNKLNQKSVELTRERESIEYKIESQLAQQRQAAAARMMAARRSQLQDAKRQQVISRIEAQRGIENNQDDLNSLGYSRDEISKAMNNKNYQRYAEAATTLKMARVPLQNVQRILNKYKGQEVPGIGALAGNIGLGPLRIDMTAEELEDATILKRDLGVITQALTTAKQKGVPSDFDIKLLDGSFLKRTENAALIGMRVDSVVKDFDKMMQLMPGKLDPTAHDIFLVQHQDYFSPNPNLSTPRGN